MIIWLPISIIALIVGLRYSKKSFACIFLFSTFTGASILEGIEKGIQPLYLIIYVILFFNILRFLEKKKKIILPPLPIVWLFILSTIFILLSLLSVNVSPGQFFYIITITIVVQITYLITEKMTFEEISESIINISIIIFIYGIVDVILRYFDLPTLSNFFVNSNSVQNNTWATTNGIPRAMSVFSEPSFLGVFSAVILLYCLTLAMNKDKVKVHHIKKTIVLSAVNLFLTASISGFLVFVYGLLYIYSILMLSRSTPKIITLLKTIVIISISCLIFLFILKFFSPYFFDSLTSWILMRFQFTDASTMSRLLMLTEGYRIMFQYPLTGVGLGNFISVDLFSTIAGATGLIGLTLFSIWFAIPIFRSFVLSKNRKINYEKLPFFIIFFSFFIVFSTSLGHLTILWPWILLGTSIRFVYPNCSEKLRNIL